MGMRRKYEPALHGDTPHPGCLVERVRICLIPKELVFLAATKSAEPCVGKGVSSVGRMAGKVICSANMRNSIR
jgi:hypothetical protein